MELVQELAPDRQRVLRLAEHAPAHVAVAVFHALVADQRGVARLLHRRLQVAGRRQRDAACLRLAGLADLEGDLLAVGKGQSQRRLDQPARLRIAGGHLQRQRVDALAHRHAVHTDDLRAKLPAGRGGRAGRIDEVDQIAPVVHLQTARADAGAVDIQNLVRRGNLQRALAGVHIDVTVADGDRQVGQRLVVGGHVARRIGGLDLRQVVLANGVPVQAALLGVGVAHLEHGEKRVVALQDALARKVGRGGRRFLQRIHRCVRRAVKGDLAVTAQGGQRVACGQADRRVVRREVDAVGARAAGEALRVVGRIDEEGALAERARLRVRQIGGVGGLVHLLEPGVAV